MSSTKRNHFLGGNVDWLCANSSISSMQRLATTGLTGLPIAQPFTGTKHLPELKTFTGTV
jgi:hypothetical protein